MFFKFFFTNLIKIFPLFERQDSRESRYNAVRALLEDNIKLRERSETRFQTYFEKELGRLKNEYFKEAEVGLPLSSLLSLFWSHERMLIGARERRRRDNRGAE